MQIAKKTYFLFFFLMIIFVVNNCGGGGGGGSTSQRSNVTLNGITFDANSNNISLFNFVPESLPATYIYEGYGSYTGSEYTENYSSTSYEGISAIKMLNTGNAHQESSEYVYALATDGYINILKATINGVLQLEAGDETAPVKHRPKNITAIGTTWTTLSGTETVIATDVTAYGYAGLTKIKWEAGSDIDYSYELDGFGQISDHWSGSDYPSGNG